MSTLPPLPMLHPKLLGERWENYEGSSSFGVFWRAARLNTLHRSDLRSSMHLTIRPGDDVFARLTRTKSQHAALQFTYPVPEFLEHPYWRIESWWPFGGAVPFDQMGWHLRVCPICARSCYHSLLFQMPGVHACPWHQAALIDACPKCERPLLADFHDDVPAGRCRCGHDLVNYVATAEGETTVHEARKRTIHRHLAQAASSRKRTWLLAPESNDDQAWQALHWLADDTAPTSETVLRDRVVLDRSLKYPPSRLSPKCGLETFRPSLVALPGEWAPAFQHIGVAVIGMVPRSCFSNAGGPSNHVRRSMGQLPAYAGGRNIFVDTESLDRVVLRSACQLATVLSNPKGLRAFIYASFSHRVREHPHGLRLVDAVLRRIMTRGYADGVRVILGRRIPAMYDEKRLRPVRRFPWALMDFEEDRPPSAKIAWTRQRGTF